MEDPEASDNHRSDQDDEDGGMFLFKKVIENSTAPSKVLNEAVLVSDEND